MVLTRYLFQSLSTKITILTSCVKYHQSVIDNARAAEKSQPGRPLAIALDTVSQPGHLIFRHLSLKDNVERT
jgi:hypothetical protein